MRGRAISLCISMFPGPHGRLRRAQRQYRFLGKDFHMTESLLTGIPETMLWTLHNRAGEAARPDGCLRDPECVRIYRSIDYDYERSFGPSEPSHAMRSLLFDEQLRAFLARHPDGVIVNLGEGLETQRYRIQDYPEALWLSVDVPDAMAVRERFIQPDAHHLHIACSALDTAWFDAVPPGKAVFITAQGLFMYFTAQDVGGLLHAMQARFAGAWLMFDYNPPWISARTMSEQGWMKTPHYRTPPMPWGIRRDALPAFLTKWLGRNPACMQPITYRFPRGYLRWLFPVLTRTPYLKNILPGIFLVQFAA